MYGAAIGAGGTMYGAVDGTDFKGTDYCVKGQLPPTPPRESRIPYSTTRLATLRSLRNPVASFVRPILL